MDDQKFEDLAKRYPALFKKAEVDYFGTGNGWYTILETLCDLLSADVSHAEYRLKHSIDNNLDDMPIHQAQFEKAINDLPVILQVKEKFGGLRFYADNRNTKSSNYIHFAETLSLRTCEECGAPGEPRNTGWVKTLCQRHHLARENKDQNGT